MWLVAGWTRKPSLWSDFFPGPLGHRGFISYLFLSYLCSHSRTCRSADTRPAPNVFGDAGNRLQSGITRVVFSRPFSWKAGWKRRALRRIGTRPQAEGRGMVTKIEPFADRRTSPVFSSHIYHSVSSRRWNERTRTEAWECRVQRRKRRQTRELHTDPELKA